MVNGQQFWWPVGCGFGSRTWIPKASLLGAIAVQRRPGVNGPLTKMEDKFPDYRGLDFVHLD